MKTRYWLILACYLFQTLLTAQYTDLVGITQTELVTYQPDGEIVLRQTITALPSPALIRNVSYVATEDTYYALFNTTDNPALLPIASDGTAGLPLPLTLNGEAIPLVEAAAYHRGEDAIYVAASIEAGVSQNDTGSETLLRVDRTTGNCTLVARLATGYTNVPDIDNMAFDGERLYFYDGTPAPNPQISEVFGRLYFADDWRDNNSFLPALFYDSDYLRVTDLTVRCGEVYFGVDGEGLYAVDPTQPELRSVASNVFDGAVVSGITQFPREVALTPGQDTILLCAGEEIEVTFPAFDADIRWSDGLTGQLTRTFSESGDYTVEATTGNCPVFTDSIVADSRNCEACEFAIPDIFSPNGDDQNDQFGLYFQSEDCVISDARITVFNRWGQKVFQGRGGQTWDGNYRNKPAPMDVYLYLVRFTVRTETGAMQHVEQSGEITLVR